MLQQLVEYLIGQGKSDSHAKMVRGHEFLSNKRKLAFEHNGELHFQDRELPTRNFKVHSVADFIEIVKKYGKDKGAGSSVWVSETAIVAVLDDNDPFDRASVSLTFSELFQLVQALDKNPTLEHAALLRLLRRDFCDCEETPALNKSLAKISFRSTESGSSAIGQGQESLGREIENEVTGVDKSAIGTVLTVKTPVFSNPGEADFTIPIILDLEVDAANRRFILKPMPNEVASAKQASLNGICERLAEGLKDVGVYFGSP